MEPSSEPSIEVEPPGLEPTAVVPASAVSPASRTSGASSDRTVASLPRRSSEVPQSSEPQSEVEPPGLEAEVAALDRATSALRSNDPAGALRWLAEHERSFPHGRLVDVRKATRVRALCQLGREAEAQAEAAALHREHPSSAVARRVPDSCGEA